MKFKFESFLSQQSHQKYLNDQSKKIQAKGTAIKQLNPQLFNRSDRPLANINLSVRHNHNSHSNNLLSRRDPKPKQDQSQSPMNLNSDSKDSIIQPMEDFYSPPVINISIQIKDSRSRSNNSQYQSYSNGKSEQKLKMSFPLLESQKSLGITP